MNPADIILNIRQRSEWETVDLGFTLVQSTWKSVFPAWALFLFLLAACCALLIPKDYMWAAGLTLWWLKPLYDRIILHILSRKLFAQTLSIADVFSALPHLITKTGLLSALTWRRFSWSRSFTLPVWQLEQLHGKSRKERQDILSIQGHSHAIGLTFSCILLEIIIVLSIYALILLLDPTGQVWEHVKGIFTDTHGSDIEYWLSLGDLLFQVLAIMLIEPFYVAAGFALYLNRRTQLEAWDIEIAFRSMGTRLSELAQKASQGLMVTLVPFILTALLLAPPALNAAAEDEILNTERLPVSATEQQIEQVMQAEELNNKRQVTTWFPRNKERNNDNFEVAEELVQLLSAILKYLLWVVVLVAVILALVYHKRILALLKPPRKQEEIIEKPDVLFGMDIRPESLPDDIASHARQLWQQGQHRNALGLLYRGALMQLTRHDHLAIVDSHTEGDILQLARPELSTPRFDYLRTMTRLWQSIAYAHRTPEDHDAEELFSGWQTFENEAKTTTETGA